MNAIKVVTIKKEKFIPASDVLELLYERDLEINRLKMEIEWFTNERYASKINARVKELEKKYGVSINITKVPFLKDTSHIEIVYENQLIGSVDCNGIKTIYDNLIDHEVNVHIESFLYRKSKEEK